MSQHKFSDSVSQKLYWRFHAKVMKNNKNNSNLQHISDSHDDSTAEFRKLNTLVEHHPQRRDYLLSQQSP